MPIIPNQERRDWKPAGDFRRKMGVTHCFSEPDTHDGLVDLMDDMGAVDEAEAYRFLKPGLMRVIISEAAERVEVDLRGDYYRPAEAVMLFMSRQAVGRTRMGVTIDPEGNREIRSAS